jgi:hypothetical protein
VVESTASDTAPPAAADADATIGPGAMAIPSDATIGPGAMSIPSDATIGPGAMSIPVEATLPPGTMPTPMASHLPDLPPDRKASLLDKLRARAAAMPPETRERILKARAAGAL